MKSLQQCIWDLRSNIFEKFENIFDVSATFWASKEPSKIIKAENNNYNPPPPPPRNHMLKSTKKHPSKFDQKTWTLLIVIWLLCVKLVEYLR